MWFKDLLVSIFRGNKHLTQENFLDDVTKFLFDLKFEDNVLDLVEPGEEEQYNKYIKSLEDRYNNAVDFGATPSTNT